MSQETRKWLSENILVGYTAERGNAWHYREGDNNHFEQAVPYGRVADLFNFTVEKRPIVVAGKERDGVAWYSPEHDTVFGYFSGGAKIHPYSEWLIGNTATLLGGNLEIGSAGLLRQRKVAFLQAEVPETIKDSATGEAIRATVLASTSLDGTLASNYRLVFTRVACDNALGMALKERLAAFRVKHTRFSEFNPESAQEALGLLDEATTVVMDEIRRLTEQPVSRKQFDDFLTAFIPMPTEKGRGRTRAINRRDAIVDLYDHDERVAPWKGTAWGVAQAVNTYHHHLGIVRGSVARFERNMISTIKGDFVTSDQKTLKTLEGVLA